MQNSIRGSGSTDGLLPEKPVPIRGSGSTDGLLPEKPVPQPNENIKNESDRAGGDVCSGTVKLNANAKEFVPWRLRKETMFPGNDDLEENPSPQKKTIGTQVNADSDEDLGASDDNMSPPWQGFPKGPIKVDQGSQVVMLNDNEYMIMRSHSAGKNAKEFQGVPPETTEPQMFGNFSNYSPIDDSASESRRLLNEKRYSAGDELRREQERKVALEALLLAENRRSRAGRLLPNVPTDDALEPPQVVHLSRSPVRYSAAERTRVDALRHAKQERIDKILQEMSVERKVLAPKEPSSPTSTPSSSPPGSNSSKSKRYIPTAKEWDEQRRAKQMANQDGSPGPQSQQPIAPRYQAPPPVLPGERRRGNLTHWGRMPVWTLYVPQQPLPNVDKEGKPIQRYTIEELLHLEPEPKDLVPLRFQQKHLRMGFIY